jgi:hypothetical protein
MTRERCDGEGAVPNCTQKIFGWQKYLYGEHYTGLHLIIFACFSPSYAARYCSQKNYFNQHHSSLRNIIANRMEDSMNLEDALSTTPIVRVEEELGKSTEDGTSHVNQQEGQTSRTSLTNRWSMISLPADGNIDDDSSVSRRSSASLDAQRLFQLEAKQAAGSQFRRSSFTASIQSLKTDGITDDKKASEAAITFFGEDDFVKQPSPKTVVFSQVHIREYPYVKKFPRTTGKQ